MLEERVQLKETTGLQERAAANFVNHANRFQSDIYVEKDQIIYNGKSIMSILHMNAGQGEELILKTEGPDENEAMKDLVHYLEKEINDYSH